MLPFIGMRSEKKTSDEKSQGDHFRAAWTEGREQVPRKCLRRSALKKRSA